MRRSLIAIIVLSFAFSGCSGPSTIYGGTPGGGASGASATLGLSPLPLELSNDTTSDSFTVSGDVAGVSYTPTVDPSCTTAQGSIDIAGDGQAQLDQAGAPLMFLAFATGATPPASCTVTVKGSDGTYGTGTVTYQTIVIDTNLAPKRPMNITPAGVNPTSLTITKASQVTSLAASNFSGTVTAKVSSNCATGSGITVSPASVTGGAGTFTVAPFGQGSVALNCSITIADGANNSLSVPVAIAIGALHKFTTSSKSLQFSCGKLPASCSTAAVTLSEPSATSISIITRPGLKTSCANGFLGPMTMNAGNGVLVPTVDGPTATVTFDGFLPSAPLTCSTVVVTDNGDPAQRLTMNVAAQIGTSGPTAAAPPCVGPDPHVAVPGAPHGMYVWNPYNVIGGEYEAQLESSVLHKDPTLCGVSLVVKWSDLEAQKGVYDFSSIDGPNGVAQPYYSAGLTVNLLFEAGPERGQNNPVTPSWVTDSVANGGDAVPIVTCDDQPPAPDYMSSTFESDWFAFIAKAVQHFSYTNSTMAAHIGYMRFAVGFGVEAIPAHFDTGAHADCLGKWEHDPVDFTYDGWVQHAKNTVNAMGRQTTDKQLLVAMNELDGGTSFYDYPNAVAEDAAGKGIGFGTENLGISNVALPTSNPAACNPTLKIVNLYWCQAFTRHVGEVPFEFQTIVASTAPVAGESPIDLGKALEYGLDNNTQIFELYPQEWLAADVAGFTTASDQKAHAAALHDASLVLGANPNL